MSDLVPLISQLKEYMKTLNLILLNMPIRNFTSNYFLYDVVTHSKTKTSLIGLPLRLRAS